MALLDISTIFFVSVVSIVIVDLFHSQGVGFLGIYVDHEAFNNGTFSHLTLMSCFVLFCVPVPGRSLDIPRG